MLLDDGSNADVLSAHLILSFKIFESDIKLMTSPMFGVVPIELPMLGWIDLPLMLKGTLVKMLKELFTSTMIRFITLDVASS